MRIALATSEHSLPPSDELLRQALERRGARAEAARWSDPELDWRRFDAVVVRSCWDYHLRLPEFLAWIDRVEAWGLTLVNPANLIRWNANKRYLRAMLLPIPESVWLEGEDEMIDLGSLCRARGWSAAVVKPLVSASAWRTELRSQGLVHGPALVQEFVPEIARGEWSLVYCGSVLSHAVRKVPAPGEFRVQKEFGGRVTPAPVPRSVLELGGQAIAALPEPAALARIDIVESAGQPLLMEAEAIEPELFLTESAAAPALAASAVLRSVMRMEAVR